MSGNRQFPIRLLIVALLAVVGLASLVFCQEPAGPASDPNVAVPSSEADDSPTPDPGSEAKSADRKVIREQSIYIPYDELRKVFEKQGRGVFLPYEKFRELWDAAREKTEPAADQEPPVGALIAEVENEATVEQDVVRVKAVVKIEVLAKGWNEVPLRLSDAAITEATLDGQPARIVTDGNAGYKLLLENTGEGSQQVELTLHYANAITRSPGRNSVSFQPPQAPVSRWRVRIPEPGVEVNLHPVIAATEVPVDDAAGEPSDAAAEETVILAFVGAAPTVRIEWTPKAEGATGLEALASVRVEQQSTIAEGVIRTRAQLTYNISRAELGQLSIEIPPDQKVVNVFDANVRSFSQDQQTITAQLHEPAKGTQSVIVELEKFLGDEQAAPPEQQKEQPPEEVQAEARKVVRVPVVKALGVGRQQGVLVVRVDDGLRAEVIRVNRLLQIGTVKLPQTLARESWTFSYSYATVPFDLEIAVEKVQPRVIVETLVEAELRPKRLSVDVLSIYTVERAAVFRLELDVPPGFEVLEAMGREVAGAAAVQVEGRHLEGENKTRLVVNLARKAMGRVGLLVQLQKKLDESDLLTPGEKANLPLPMPQVAAESVERVSGRLIVYAPENLLVNPVEDEPLGFRSITTTAALGGFQGAPGRDLSEIRPIKAYAYTQEHGQLELVAERRKPQVRVRQLLAADIRDGAVDYRASFFYDVLYSSVKSLRIDVPADVSEELRTNTTGLTERKIVPPPADVAEGYVAWSFSSDTELIGRHALELVWRHQIDRQVDDSKPIDVVIPQLKPVGADLPSGQIVLTKADTIDLRVSGDSGLRSIDPQFELMPEADLPGAVRAYEFHGDWSLSVAATRYELEEIKRASIERALLRMVVTRADKIAVQALYQMRSVQQRVAVRLPKEAEFDAEPRIDGSPVPLEIEPTRQDEYLIPLIDRESRESFLLELRYTVPCEGSFLRFDRPVFPLASTADQTATSQEQTEGDGADATTAEDEPAMQEMYLCVYLPDELDLLKKEGPWTEQFSLGQDYEPSDWELLNWVSPDLDLNESFPIDGRLYVFSALRPEAPPDGSLYLATCDSNWLSTCVLGGVALIGLVLLPLGIGKRVFVIGLLAIGLVVCGVFNPILVQQICNGAMQAAVAVVLIVWLIWYFVWTRPRTVAGRRSTDGDQPPPGTPQDPVPAPPPGPEKGTSPFSGPSPAGPTSDSPAPEKSYGVADRKGKDPTAQAKESTKTVENLRKPHGDPAGDYAIEWDPALSEDSSEVYMIKPPSDPSDDRNARGKGGDTNE